MKPLFCSRRPLCGSRHRLAVGVVLFGLWEIGCRLASIPVYLFPKAQRYLRKPRSQRSVVAASR